MAIAQAGSPTSVKTVGSGTTGAMDSTVGSVDLIVLGINGPSTAYCTGDDSVPNTWDDGTPQVNNPGAMAVGLPHLLGPSTSGSHTFTSQTNIFFQGIVAAAFSGVGSFDFESGISAVGPTTTHPLTNTAVDGGDITPGGDGALLVASIAFDADPGTLTPSTGFAVMAFTGPSGNATVALIFEIQTTATTRTPSVTSANSVRSCATTKSFLPSGGGGGGVGLEAPRTITLLQAAGRASIH